MLAILNNSSHQWNVMMYNDNDNEFKLIISCDRLFYKLKYWFHIKGRWIDQYIYVNISSSSFYFGYNSLFNHTDLLCKLQSYIFRSGNFPQLQWGRFFATSNHQSCHWQRVGIHSLNCSNYNISGYRCQRIDECI